MAIIASPYDLGAVTALWRKPRAYARFLGIELSLAYKQRLLVVMPNGFGFNWPGHSSASAYRRWPDPDPGGRRGSATRPQAAVIDWPPPRASSSRRRRHSPSSAGAERAVGRRR